MEKKNYRQQMFTGERALFQTRDALIADCTFANGESPLKESGDLALSRCYFRWKYPLWYCKDVLVSDSVWFENARAGVWYTDRVTVSDSLIEAPKNFRRCDGVTLANVSFSNAAETLWTCKNVALSDVTVTRGDYFGMNCDGVTADRLTLYGNYGFDGAKNLYIRNSRLLTKDAFWNCENVTVEDSFISGEYLGWNTKNLTLVNCTVESLQGLCYIENLVMKNCRLVNTTLAFEYSTVDAEITTKIDSVFNPAAGRIRAKSIGQLIMEADKIDPARTQIITEE
ncbi:MAG: DUF3737 family protein [Clostridia bacterium]|nr:DUF3737 family protein [Clostridia bacterium]